MHAWANLKEEIEKKETRTFQWRLLSCIGEAVYHKPFVPNTQNIIMYAANITNSTMAGSIHQTPVMQSVQKDNVHSHFNWFAD